MSTAQPKQVIGLHDEEYQKIKAIAKRCGRAGIKLKGKQGPVRFYLRDGVLYGMTSVGEQEVMNLSTINHINREARVDDWMDKLYDKIKADHPEKSDEEIRADCDVLVEANDTIKRLIEGGLTADLAYKVVCETLRCNGDIQKINELIEEEKRETMANQTEVATEV